MPDQIHDAALYVQTVRENARDSAGRPGDVWTIRETYHLSKGQATTIRCALALYEGHLSSAVLGAADGDEFASQLREAIREMRPLMDFLDNAPRGSRVEF